MGQCNNCGNMKGKLTCKLCDRSFCPDCVYKILSDIMERTITLYGVSKLTYVGQFDDICSDCIDRYGLIFKERTKNDLPYASCPKCGLGVYRTFYQFIPKLVKWPSLNFQGQLLCLQAYCRKCDRIYSEKHFWATLRPCEGADWDEPIWFNYAMARSAEIVERIEDAALHYEKAGMIEKAKELRLQNRKQYIYNTNVDINQLLLFLKENNYTIPYKCPSCKATIKISGQREADKFFNCEYCGTALQAIDIQTLINSLM